MVCKSPPGLSMQSPSAFPTDIPFGLALTSDVFDPWTETSNKFRYYRQPELELISPIESGVGVLTEVMVQISREQDDTKKDNVFFEPLPNSMVGTDAEGEHDDDYAPLMASYGAIKCRFGRFGETVAVFLNTTHVKCVTP